MSVDCASVKDLGSRCCKLIAALALAACGGGEGGAGGSSIAGFAFVIAGGFGANILQYSIGTDGTLTETAPPKSGT